MRISLSAITLLAAGWLSATTSRAQQLSSAPTPEQGGPIQIVPDSATRSLFRHAHVRSVVKLRLTDEGEVRDTAYYQEIDQSGRVTRFHERQNPQLHREWSYDAQGRCTSLLTHPTPTFASTLIYTYNPELRLGSQDILKPNGNRITLAEIAQQTIEDAVVTDTKSHALLINGSILNKETRLRSVRYPPHPDTVLILHFQYNGLGRLESSTATYRFSRQGRVLEIGSIDMRQAASALKVKAAPGQLAPVLSYAQTLHTLRQGKYLYYQYRWHYDDRHRVAQLEARNKLRPGQYAVMQTTYTYNSANQLVARQESKQSVYSPLLGSYSVFSYAPSGLLLSETSNSRSEKPIFYRYQYEYYEQASGH